MRTLGRYELHAPLGSGGMGTVWAAELIGAHGFRKPVAVKVLDAAVPEKRVPQLIEEARIGAMTSHPNVVPSFDVGCHDGVWFIAMERVDGPSAQALLEQGVLDPAALLDLGAQSASGLHYLHGLKGTGGTLVHGDIKPHNLLVDRSGLVRIVDFGVAALIAGASVQGTLNYMAPEHLQTGPVPASDVFSLAVTLYTLATGHRLLGDTPWKRRALVVRALANDDYPWQRLDNACPGLGPLVRAAMAPEPEDRPTAAVFGGQLQRLAIRADGASLLERVGRTPQPLMVEAQGRQTPLVGREDEMAALRDALASPGVVLVTGPAGSGKSRLAREVLPQASVLALTGARSRNDVFERLADWLGVELPPDASPEWWGERLPDVVVLDDADGVATVLPRLLERLGDRKVVITSRVRLEADHIVELGPLDEADAVELFQRLSPTEAPTEEIVPVVRALDCLPLALQITAAHGDTQSSKELLDQLDGAAPLDEALELSWSLLDTGERETLLALAAFRGSVDLSDLQAVAGVGALAGLAGLLQHSLVQADGERVRLLGSVRDFVAQKGDVPRRAHAWRFAQRGTPQALEALRRTGGSLRFRGLLADAENLDEALTFAGDQPELLALLTLARLKIVERRGPLEAGVQLARRVAAELQDDAQVAVEERLAWCLERSGDVAGAAEIAHSAAARAESAALRSDCLRREGICRLKLGDVDAATLLTEQALQLALAIGDVFRAGEVHLNAAIVAAARGDTERRAEHDREALRLAKTHGHLVLVGMVLGNLAREQLHHGRYDRALKLQRQALAAFEASGNRLAQQNARAVVGAIQLERGHISEARSQYSEVLREALRAGQHAEIVHYSSSLAEVEIQAGDLEAAGRHLDRGERMDPAAQLDVIRAMWLRHQGRVQEALNGLAQLTETTRYLGAHVMLESARCLLLLGRIDAAVREADQAVRIFRELRRPAQLALGLVVLARARRASGADVRELIAGAESLRDRLGLEPTSPVGQELAAF